MRALRVVGPLARREGRRPEPPSGVGLCARAFPRTGPAAPACGADSYRVRGFVGSYLQKMGHMGRRARPEGAGESLLFH